MIGQHTIACSSSRVRRVPQQIRRASSKASITSKIQAPYWRCICSILIPPNPSSTHVLLLAVKPRPCPVSCKIREPSTPPIPTLCVSNAFNPTCNDSASKTSEAEKTSLSLARHQEAYDGILVDAPRSNTGVMRRRLDVRWRLSTSEIQTCCEQQSALLESTAPWVRPGGRMVYSTCSLEPEENQEQIDTFLREHSNWSLATARQLTPLQDGVDGAYAALLHRTQ